jgi:hypothetical protein
MLTIGLSKSENAGWRAWRLVIGGEIAVSEAERRDISRIHVDEKKKSLGQSH